MARPEEGVTEGAADALQNPRPLHHSLFGEWSPSPVVCATGEENLAPMSNGGMCERHSPLGEGFWAGAGLPCAGRLT